MFDLTGKTALVTGATGGIGNVLAKALHAQGAVVAVSGTRTEALEALKGELGERAFAFSCRLDDARSIEALAKEAEAAMGSIDILVNNAGITRDGLVARMRDEEWLQVIEIDLTAAFRLVRATLRGMMRKRWGRIINVGSVVGATGNAGQANYAAAKAGLVGLTKALAAEMAPRNITANCVAPGFVDTPMTRGLTDRQREMILSRVPLARLGTGADVAAAVAFLASDEAAYITGHTLHVNGGMAML
ncbi:MAG TPA: 3-oxoacyl-[acyl-carrier-protein] reductase [Alphaproteobacteria bacterium]|nr:3-oxoacyl-[acyl-carrier-protein] reductase [Alphaproteobacteria bacterium]